MEIILRVLSLEQGEKIYTTHMQRDFPADELKPWRIMRDLAKRGEYDMLGAYWDDTLVGYAWQYVPSGGDCLLLDYLAVLPQYRMRGVGAGILASLRQYYSRIILLESEYPEEAPDPAIARRRLGFYTRCGMGDTGLQLRLFGVRFCILASGTLTDAQDAMEMRYTGMLGPQLRAKAVEYI